MKCCVSGCTTTSKRDKQKLNGIKFYCFPIESTHMPWLVEKRQMWINAVRNHKKNPEWLPSKSTLICSVHFIGNKKSEKVLHPSYIPTIFPSNIENSTQEVTPEHNNQPREEQENREQNIGRQNDDPPSGNQTSIPNLEITCKAEIEDDVNTNISTDTKIKKEPNSDPLESHSPLLCPGFHGMSSFKTEESLISSTGVTFSVFDMLLDLLPESNTPGIDKRTGLLITLMKLKTGLCFSVLSVIFQVPKTTAYTVFKSNINLLSSVLKNFVIWPTRTTVRANMSESFRLQYPNTRVIIDYIEVGTESPPTLDERAHLYSEYRHGYTIKFLVGCTPCGYITFVSKCYGGSYSDGTVLNDSGIISLLEPGDTVLANTDFTPTEIENENLDTPSTSLQRRPFSLEQLYHRAAMRIHVERMIKGIKGYHILDKLPISLFQYKDEIVFVIGALVNLDNRLM